MFPAAFAAAAALSYLGWAAMSPKSQLYGRTLVRLPDARQLAFTYDDGPNDPHTLRLLELLAKHEVKATFFLIGRFVRQRPEIARAVAEAGHEIGNHTFTHPNLILTPPAAVRQELEETQRAIEDATGATPRLFRPPFGGRRPDVLATARTLGLEPVMWNVSARDWVLRSGEAIAALVTKQFTGGDIVLMHDGGHTGIGADRAATVDATRLLLERFKDGREFVAIPG